MPVPRPRSGADLPTLDTDTLTVTEAPPSPPPGPVRDALAAAAAARVERAEQAMIDMADTYAARVRNIALTRLRGPKVRQGTRHWQPSEKQAGRDIEVKALDPDAVVPDALIGEIVEAGRPVALRVARDAAADAAERLGVEVPDTSDNADGMFAVDEELLADLIDEALEDLLGGAARYAEGLRKAILTGEDDGLDLDEMLGRVEEAATKGGNWLRLGARTIGTALAGKASLEQARALGVTHTQWISRRDERVRPTHVRADGQVRPVGEPFEVGGQLLEYPGDPSGLPGTAGEVHGCRCGLIFADPDDDFWDALADIAESINAGSDAPGVADTLRSAVASTEFMQTPSELTALPGLASAVELPSDVVGYRVMSGPLDAAPGQQVQLPAGTALGLAPPDVLTTATMTVLLPAGTAVGVTGGALILAEAATVAVLASGAAGVQGRIVA